MLVTPRKGERRMLRWDERWDAFKELFRRQDIPWLEQNDPGDQLKEEFEEVWERGSIQVDEEWAKIRSLVTKGASAGSLAALTLMGSQTLGASSPKSSVFWALVIFLAVLAVLGIRHILLVRHAVIRRSGLMAHVPDGCGYTPPPIFQIAARRCDHIAATLVVVGVIKGLLVLHGLTTQATPCRSTPLGSVWRTTEARLPAQWEQDREAVLEAANAERKEK